jgi:excisionase family DNA binding protein
MTEKLLLTIEDAADVLSLSPRTLRYLIAAGDLAPVLRVGRALRIPAATVRAFVETRTAEVVAPAVQVQKESSDDGRPTLRTG